MLRDAKTTFIAERIHRPPLGGYTAPAAKAAEGAEGGQTFFFMFE
jgi:hypothetical protein